MGSLKGTGITQAILGLPLKSLTWKTFRMNTFISPMMPFRKIVKTTESTKREINFHTLLSKGISTTHFLTKNTTSTNRFYKK